MNFRAKISLHFAFHLGVNTIDCGSEYYLFSADQCVLECPCGTAPYPEFCYEGVF